MQGKSKQNSQMSGSQYGEVCGCDRNVESLLPVVRVFASTNKVHKAMSIPTISLGKGPSGNNSLEAARTLLLLLLLHSTHDDNHYISDWSWIYLYPVKCHHIRYSTRHRVMHHFHL